MEKSDTEQPASGATRALVSAGIFGALGALFGRWLGHRGNAPESNMAKPMMTWSMGAFWAFLAAYSALKSNEAEKLPPVPEVVLPTTSAPQPEPEPIKTISGEPVATVDATTLEHAGALAQAPVLQHA